MPSIQNKEPEIYVGKYQNYAQMFRSANAKLLDRKKIIFLSIGISFFALYLYFHSQFVILFGIAILYIAYLNYCLFELARLCLENSDHCHMNLPLLSLIQPSRLLSLSAVNLKQFKTKHEAIAAEHTQFMTMLAVMQEGIITVNEKEEIIYANKAAQKYLSLETTRHKKIPLKKYASCEMIHQMLNIAKRQGQDHKGEVKISSEQKTSTLSLNISKLQGLESEGYIIVLHDVSTIRHLERMRRDFVANVSHEIKTPLTSIKGYTETLLNGAINDPINNIRFLQKVFDNTQRLTSLVHDILSLANIESEDHVLVQDHMAWETIIKQVLSRYESILKKKDLRISLEASHKFNIIAEHESMIQIFDNLLTNAVRYSSSQNTIHIKLFIQNSWGVMSIRDHGIGIPQKYQDRIFERFYRVDKDRSRQLGGTGLGLAIVKHLISSLGGQITVSSKEGLGSTFSVFLPLSNS